MNHMDEKRRKAIANFWDYHKLHILVALAAILFVGYLVWDLLDRPAGDYQVTYVGIYTLDADQCQWLTERISGTGKDSDGDGQVTVQLQQIQLDNTGAEGLDMLYRTKLLTQLSQGSSQLYLLDSTALEIISSYDSSFFSQCVPMEWSIPGLETPIYGALPQGAEETLVTLLESL